MFQRALLLDLTVPAMVIRKYEPFGRNELSSTEAAEADDCIFERAVVDAVDVLSI